MTYVAILVLMVSVISVGYQSPVEKKATAQSVDGGVLQVENPSVDQRVAAELAASAAETADLAVTSNVVNMSISLTAKAELAQTDTSVLAKPQIIEIGSQRGISSYTAIAGDTVPLVAAKYGVSVDTVRWSNSLIGDAITLGSVLKIPNVDGVIYVVREGDTLESIASKYGAASERIVSYNDLEVGGITPGQQIVLPGGVLPENERPGYQAVAAGNVRSTNSQIVAYTGNAASVGNRYDYGYCTWYAYNRRAELGRPVGSFWGNASSWASFARGSGYGVNSSPEIGAVMQDSYSAGGYGHVAVVESKNADGSIVVSEMNYAGWNVRSYRTLSASEATRYNFIH